MNLCHICYTNNLLNINCENKTCSSIICEDCFEIYLNFCETENKLCKCVNDSDEFIDAIKDIIKK